MKMTPERLAMPPIGKKLRLAPPKVKGVDIRPDATTSGTSAPSR